MSRMCSDKLNMSQPTANARDRTGDVAPEEACLRMLCPQGNKQLTR